MSLVLKKQSSARNSKKHKKRNAVTAVGDFAHEAIAKPIEKQLNKIKPGLGDKFHEDIWLEKDSNKKNWKEPEFVDKMPKGKKSKKKSKKKSTKKRQSVKRAITAALSKPMRMRRTFKGGRGRRGRGHGGSRVGLTRMPGVRLVKGSLQSGLTMGGGWIRGTTEITPNLSLSSANNVQGGVLFSLPLSAIGIAPGSRFSSFASNYDLYCFKEAQLEIKPDIPYQIAGLIGGGYERDSADQLPGVGGQIDVPKYMEHQHWHSENITNKSSVRFPKEKNACFTVGKGPTSGKFFNRLPSSGQDLNATYQGQLVIFVHTPLATDITGQALSFPVSLGPLLFHWKIDFKEAAEKNQLEGQEDNHLASTLGPVANPLNWTTTASLQSSLQISLSTLEILTWYNGGSWNAYLPLGQWDVQLIVQFGTTGTAGFNYPPNGGGQTLISSEFTSPLLSSSNVWVMSHLRLQQTNNSSVILFANGGNSAGYTVIYAQMLIRPIPFFQGENLFTHSDHVLRSIAFAKQRFESVGTNAVDSAVERKLKMMGLFSEEKKGESKWDSMIRARFDEIRSWDRKNHPRTVEEKKGKVRIQLEEDDWEEPEETRFYHDRGYEDDDFGLMRGGMTAYPWGKKKNMVVDDEREEKKAPTTTTRSSSLK